MLLEGDRPEPKPFKAFLAASVTTKDEKFSNIYQEVLEATLKKFGILPLKPLYKGAHLVKQADEKSAQVMCALLDAVEPMISHIDLYCAYYRQNTISVFGQAQGQQIQPLTFIEKNQNSFAHVAAWFWHKNYEYKEGYALLLDHFEGKITPAWRELEKNVSDKIKVYYSGGECNSLISLADLVLKLVETFHFGYINQQTLIRPIEDRCIGFRGKGKVRCHNLGGQTWLLRTTTPDIPLDIHLTPYIKHPIFFIAWSPNEPRDLIKPSFEWSRKYNMIMQKAIESNGCVKFLKFDKDMVIWDNKDYIIPIMEVDQKHVESLAELGYEKMPTIVPISELHKFKA
jgi:hypothetical protein